MTKSRSRSAGEGYENELEENRGTKALNSGLVRKINVLKADHAGVATGLEILEGKTRNQS